MVATVAIERWNREEGMYFLRIGKPRGGRPAFKEFVFSIDARGERMRHAAAAYGNGNRKRDRRDWGFGVGWSQPIGEGELGSGVSWRMFSAWEESRREQWRGLSHGQRHKKIPSWDTQSAPATITQAIRESEGAEP